MREGYLIKTHSAWEENSYIGPNGSILYKFRTMAENARKRWPGLSDAEVVKVEIIEVEEDEDEDINS